MICIKIIEFVRLHDMKKDHVKYFLNRFHGLPTLNKEMVKQTDMRGLKMSLKLCLNFGSHKWLNICAQSGP